MGVVLTESDIIEAVLAALQNSDEYSGALTVQEIADKAGISRDAVRKRLRSLPNVKAVRVRRLALDGVYRYVPAYYLEGDHEQAV